MSEQLRAPRTLDYQILRVCERLSLAEKEFLALPHDQQLRLLAFEQVRSLEDDARAG